MLDGCQVCGVSKIGVSPQGHGGKLSHDQPCISNGTDRSVTRIRPWGTSSDRPQLT